MRGEEILAISQPLAVSELPPHARRRVPAGKFDHSAFGITSACAEKSTVDNGTRGYAWNYLRMRGEEHDSACLGYAMSGITSACAEKSLVGAVVILPVWNYLRMRGEEPSNPGISIIP